MTFIVSCCADTPNHGSEKGYYKHDVWAVIRNTFSEKLDKKFNYIHVNDLNTIQTKEYNKPD